MIFDIGIAFCLILIYNVTNVINRGANMQYIINGGIYGVDLFDGTECDIEGSDYVGAHLTLIIQTYKEKDIYIAIPLTTYTPERWEKCKEKGYGVGIKGTNSIARIDKFRIISKKIIGTRWKSKMPKKNLRVSPEELSAIIEKLHSYINISSLLTIDSYNKYTQQYENIRNECIELFGKYNILESNIQIKFFRDDLICIILYNSVDCLSKNDIIDILSDYFYFKNIDILHSSDKSKFIFSVKNNDKFLLTFKETYDKLMVQKGEPVG